MIPISKNSMITVLEQITQRLYDGCGNRWFPNLEQAYAHTRLKNGVCPHKGVNLQSCPAVNGIVICPAHGLRWRADTGELVRDD